MSDSPELSVLELALRERGRSVGDALDAVVRTAVAADRLGYRRFWLSEHHRIPVMSTPSPGVVVARVAAATSRIRVGAGGVMLTNHSPLATAETFASLEVMFPDRIDLGLGRGPGTNDEDVLHELRGPRPRDTTYDQDVRTVLGLLAADPGTGPTPLPDGSGAPDPWLLASSPEGVELAAELGLPVSLAHFLRPDGTQAAADAYRERFRPSAYLDRPWLAIATMVVCADTEAEALARALPAAAMAREGATGPPNPLVPPDTPVDPDVDVRALIEARGCVGTPDDVRRGILDLARRTGADEIQLVVPVFDAAERIEVLASVAVALGLVTA